MSALRILHVDDEPDIREVVELSLGLDPAFVVRSCSNGTEALAAASQWRPDMMLIDVMMPDMDGPATLASLRETPETAAIPVVFMTARAQSREIAHLKSLGATGVIAKPFDPMTLAASVRSQMRTAGIAALKKGFASRLREDAKALSALRERLDRGETAPRAALGEIKAFAHALAGAAGIFGYHEVSSDAKALENAAVAGLNEDHFHQVDAPLSQLISRIDAA